LPFFIARAEAVEVYGQGDPEVDETHVFQGDIYHSQELFSPANPERPVSSAIVVSHHCEWTKAKKRLARGEDWPILLAPLHELTDFDANEQRLIRENSFR
jgi:hypothetical protein